MNHFRATYRPLVGLGMVALVLGTVALILFFLPVLGIPLSVLGLFFGLVGLGGALYDRDMSLRWPLGGAGMSALALLVNLAIVYAPGGYTPAPEVRQPWRAAPDRPYVPPPASGMLAPGRDGPRAA